ncbi:type II secretion system protein GspL [Colwelliaceae bacterium BS250]
MKETLYIRIGSDENAPIQWLITNDQQSDEIASGTIANKNALVELSEKAQDRKVKVLINGIDVRLKALTVPGKAERAIKNAAPYMLEDELADDVETLFFAHTNKPAGFIGNENCFMAIVSIALLEQWLSWFADANIIVKHMLPDTLAMPLNAEQWTAITIDEQLLVRQSAWSGFSLDNQLAEPFFRQLLADIEEPQLLQSYAPLHVNVENLVIDNVAEELPMLLLAKGFEQQSFNLLQGDYQVKEQRSPVLKNWLWVAGIAMVAFTLNLSAKIYDLTQLNNEYEQINARIETSYKKSFPATRKVRINTVKRQITSALTELGGGSSDSGFLALLEQLKSAFNTVPQLKPDSIRFDAKRNELRLSVTASDYQSFEKFKAELEKSNLKVETGAQNNQGDKVVGSFNIRSK